MIIKKYLQLIKRCDRVVNMDVRIQQRNIAPILNLPISHVQGWVEGLLILTHLGAGWVPPYLPGAILYKRRLEE